MLSSTRAQGCWLRMCCHSSPEPPAPTSSSSQCARLCQAQPPPQSPPQLPGSKCPQSSQQPLPTAVGEPCASGWGTAGVFSSDYCELAHSQVGPGQENELVRAAQPKPRQAQLPPSSASAARTGPALPVPGTWQRAQLLCVARHILQRGVLLLILLLIAPGAVCLAVVSTCIS